MGIFRDLKACKDRLTVKGLSEFLRYSVKLAEANANSDTLKSCIKNGEYPKFYWKILRRNHIYPNGRTLKRHTLNLIDAIQTRLPELENNVSQRMHFLFELTETERSLFQ
ncbi:unnamed protein product, partial [Trichobilharzia szidati]